MSRQEWAVRIGSVLLFLIIAGFAGVQMIAPSRIRAELIGVSVFIFVMIFGPCGIWRCRGSWRAFFIGVTCVGIIFPLVCERAFVAKYGILPWFTKPVEAMVHERNLILQFAVDSWTLFLSFAAGFIAKNCIYRDPGTETKA
jgi:hypothetical protein